MAFDGIANIQSRIAEIQQQFDPSAASTDTSNSTTTSASNNVAFSDMLAAASAIGSDGSTTTSSATDATGTGSSALASSLASSLTGSSGSSLSTLLQALTGTNTGSSAGGTSTDPLSALLQQLTGVASSTGSSGLAGSSSLAGLTSAPGATSSIGAGTSAANQTFLQNALAQAGDAYVWGASANPADPHPKAFDCSELVKWAGARAGVTIPDVAQNQYLWLKNQGKLIPVQQAINTPGALLFSFSSEPSPGNMYPSHAHVAISLGNGKTIEARGKDYGVGIFDAANRFNYAGVVPGLTA